MLLKAVSVDAFRTLTTPQNIEIDPKITVLVGANESGKTNLLEAMQCLSLDKNLNPEDISKSKRRRYARKELPEINFTFSISQEDKDQLSKLVPALAEEDTIIIKKQGNGIDGYSLFIPKENILKKNKLIEEEFKTSIKEIEKKIKLAKNTLNLKKSIIGTIRSSISKGKIKVAQHSQKLDKIEILKLEIIDVEKLLNELNEQKATSEGKLADFLKKSSTTKVGNLMIANIDKQNIINLLPNVSYTKDIEFIPEFIPIAEIIAQKSPRSIAIGNLLKIGELDDLTILNETPRRLKPLLRGVGNVVSSKLLEVWKQEPIELELTKEGANLVISVIEKVSISSSPTERSEGFQWFLSFFANFPTELNGKSNRNIILLDEPAIRLHPEGQKNLLVVLEDISNASQVIYTSHSPFLINRNYPQRIRLLKKDFEKGTIIDNKPYSDGKTRFWEPLKSAIGICLGDLFSLGETNLIVEGISDQIILTCISSKLSKISSSYLDLEKISIIPAMGSSTVVYLSKFASSEGLNTFALFDSDPEGEKAHSQLKSEKKIATKSVSELKKGSITIEDLIPINEYVKAVNSFYLKLGLPDYEEFIHQEEIEGTKSTFNGILSEIKCHFDSMKYSFDKVSVAKELMEIINITNENKTEYLPFTKLFDHIQKSM